MPGQMCWLSRSGSEGDKILHLRLTSKHPWKPYTLCPGLYTPDYNVPGGSKGWATYQKLLRLGWTEISANQKRLGEHQPAV